MSVPSAESDAAWDSLMPSKYCPIAPADPDDSIFSKGGRGYVLVEHPEDYNLKPGIPTDVGPDRYSVTMFHQLHCLVRLSLSPSQCETLIRDAGRNSCELLRQRER